MERRDYFKKQIDQLGRVLGKILADFLSLKNAAKAGEAVESVVQSLATKLNLDPAMLADIPRSEVVDKLIRVYGFSNDNLELLANILLTVAEERKHDHSWKKLMGHSLTIFQYLEIVDSTYSLERRFKKIKNDGID